MLKNALKIKTVKAVVNTVVGASVGFVVQTLIEASIKPQNTRDKVKLAVGSYVIGAMVADVAKSWTAKKIDGAAKTINDMKAAYQQSETQNS